VVPCASAPESPVDIQLVVFLVHGTWARGLTHQVLGKWLPAIDPVTLWYRAESGFARALRAMAGLPFEIVSFEWSGANSAQARATAAWQLREQLRHSIASHPAARHLLIAHSHGGNVALRAVQMLPSTAQRPGIATMAAPFLVGRRVSVPKREWRLLVAGAFAPVWIPAVFVVGRLLRALLDVVGVDPAAVASRMSGWGGPTIAVLLVVVTMRWFDRHRRRLSGRGSHLDFDSAPWETVYSLTTLGFLRRIRRRERVLRMIEWSDDRGETPLVLRAPADEAGIALSLARAASLIAQWPWRLFRAWVGLWRWEQRTTRARLTVVGISTALVAGTLLLNDDPARALGAVILASPLGVAAWSPPVVLGRKNFYAVQIIPVGNHHLLF
jgi:hypothetical protein